MIQGLTVSESQFYLFLLGFILDLWPGLISPDMEFAWMPGHMHRLLLLSVRPYQCQSLKEQEFLFKVIDWLFARLIFTNSYILQHLGWMSLHLAKSFCTALFSIVFSTFFASLCTLFLISNMGISTTIERATCGSLKPVLLWWKEE